MKFHLTTLLAAGVAILLSSPGLQASLTVTPESNAATLVGTIAGSGITIVLNSEIYTGAVGAAGTFTDGLASGIGIDQGILLTTGTATDAEGPNAFDDATTENGEPGDTDLSAVIGGASTFDATILQFQFETAGGDLFFKFAFASEEYNEYSDTEFNDAVGFFLDGVLNIALVPGTTDPVSVNNVNGGNPFGDPNATNPQYFNNNDLDDGGPFFDIEYDGFTDVFVARALGLGPGVHTLKLAIADTEDEELDSAVFIQAGSLSDTDPGQPGEIPEPMSLVVWVLLGGAVTVARRVGRSAD